MKGKLLLFGFDDLFSAQAIIAAVEPMGLDVVRVRGRTMVGSWKSWPGSRPARPRAPLIPAGRWGKN